MTDNLPPADELFDVREQLKALTSRERDLRSLMLSDPSARTGNRYAVEIRDVQTTRTDIKELRAMHPTLVEEYTFKLTAARRAAWSDRGWRTGQHPQEIWRHPMNAIVPVAPQPMPFGDMERSWGIHRQKQALRHHHQRAGHCVDGHRTS